MPSFMWKGRGRGGRPQEGILLADSRNAAVATLRRQSIQVTSIREKGRELAILPRFKRRVGSKTISVFTRQFSVMLEAGLPLVQCLEILGEQEDNRTFKDILLRVRSDVESGSSLAESMSRHPRAFDKLFVSMITAGEAGGILDVILQRLSTYLEKIVKLKSQVKAALVYPVSVIVIATFVVYIILWKVIPVFAQLYAGLGGELPFLTQMVVGASRFIGNWSWLLAIALVGMFFGVRFYYNTEKGRYVCDAILLKIPVIGMLLRKIAVARFCRTLSTLTASGVPILDSLEITAKTSGNAVIEESVMAVRKRVEEGKSLSGPLGETKVFPLMVVQMINVGEQTGALDQMLSKIADFYEDEVDAAVEGLMKLLEPIMITFLGVVIGTIVTAMYLPLYSLLTRIG